MKKLAFLLGLFWLLIPHDASAQAQLQAGGVWSNCTASVRPAKDCTVSALIDQALGSTRGAVIERKATGWGLINPGTSGLAFVSNGAAADPAYQLLGIGGGGTNCGAASGTCLDNITGFGSTGILNRTGAGAYSFLTAPAGTIVGTTDSQTLTNKIINCNNNTCTVIYSNLPTGSQDTVGGYFTSTTFGTASLPNCAAGTNLAYATGSHTFSCTSTVTSLTGSAYVIVTGSGALTVTAPLVGAFAQANLGGM